tara:strand:+ start:779 stop:1753 length:975 start_codon:yes stop_codon:yes gene_type:complete
MNILISGCAGFIGYHLSNYLCKKYKRSKIIGFDNLNNFYSIKLKKKRITNLKENRNFFFSKIDLNDKKKLSDLFKKRKIKIVFHLAAQAGVRDSLKMPKSYFKSNFEGYLNIINLSKINKIKKFVFASSSSVYGDQKKFPINEKMKAIPKNIYAATKKINEEIGEDLSKITDMKVIGLRFFTVYGKYGRPDMFVFRYLESLINKKNFNLFNKGNHLRDYTHIEDVVKMMDLLIRKRMNKKFEIFNICSNKPIDIYKLSIFIAKFLDKKPKLILRARNQIEVFKTHGDNRKILKFLKYKIKKNIYLELPKIINWYKQNKIWKYKF